MFKKTLGATVAALALAAAGSANALSIAAGEYQFVISNYDSGTTGYLAALPVGTPTCTTVAGCDAAAGITPAPGSGASGYDTMGIFNIESIKNITTGQVIFNQVVDGYITGVFGQLADHNVTRITAGSVDQTFTNSVGGVWAMYKNATPYDPTLGPLGAGVDLVGTAGNPLSLTYPGISGGSVFLSGVFVSGAVAGDTTTTYAADFSETKNLAGSGAGFLDITGGSAEFQFGTESLTDLNGTKRDMFLDVTFNDANNAASNLGWSVTSAGQIKGAAVPEPGALALVGMALFAAGAASRRRKA